MLSVVVDYVLVVVVVKFHRKKWRVRRTRKTTTKTAREERKKEKEEDFVFVGYFSSKKATWLVSFPSSLPFRRRKWPCRSATSSPAACV